MAVMLSDWRRRGVPAYAALADRIRLLIVDGRIPLGTRIPAERDCAAQLGISRTTVSAAYGELRETGYLTSVRGSGSVARLPRRAPVSIDSGAGDLLDLSKAALPAAPGLSDAAARALEDLPAYLGGTGFDPVGLPVLREAIAERYRRRGLPTSADEIMVTIGAQHAIALLSRTLIGRGDSAIVEVPTYPHAYEALRHAGARLVPVSVTVEEGWDGLALEQAIRRSSPALAYLMPDFQNPTGQVMSVELRQSALELAARHGTRVVADETMAELSIDDEGLEEPLAVHGNAISVGSVGKTVWGGIRLGWIRAERPLIQKLVRGRMAGDLGTPILEQLIVTHLLADYDAILQQRRSGLRAGRDHLFAALRSEFPDWTVPDVPGGLTAWVNLGLPVSSQLTIAARNHGLLLAAGPRFGIDGAFERFLRIPFSCTPEQTDRAVAALSAAWRSLSPLAAGVQPYLSEVV
jgi:DNA-binding transcriptional MocR family regulator